jgi:hypothetical protein
VVLLVGNDCSLASEQGVVHPSNELLLDLS